MLLRATAKVYKYFPDRCSVSKEMGSITREEPTSAAFLVTRPLPVWFSLPKCSCPALRMVEDPSSGALSEAMAHCPLHTLRWILPHDADGVPLTSSSVTSEQKA